MILMLHREAGYSSRYWQTYLQGPWAVSEPENNRSISCQPFHALFHVSRVASRIAARHCTYCHVNVLLPNVRAPLITSHCMWPATTDPSKPVQMRYQWAPHKANASNAHELGISWQWVVSMAQAWHVCAKQQMRAAHHQKHRRCANKLASARRYASMYKLHLGHATWVIWVIWVSHGQSNFSAPWRAWPRR